MTLQALKESDVRKLADTSAVFSRGEDYYESGEIQKFKVSASGITAKLQGNYGKYSIAIRDEKNDLITECDCPYDGDVCKHIVAVLLKYLREDYQQTTTTEKRSKKSDSSDALQQTLEAMSREELLNLLLKLSNTDDSFRRTLLENVTIPPHILSKQPRNTAKVKALKRQCDQFFKEQRYNYYGDYHEYDGDEEYEELEAIFEEARTLNAADQVEIFWHILESGNEVFEDEPGLGTPQMEEAFALYGEAVGRLNLSHKEKKTYFVQLLDALEWEMCGYGDVTEAIKKALDAICTTKEDFLYLIERFRDLDFAGAGDWITDYYLKMGDEESYLRQREANLHSEAHYIELAEFWRNKGNQAKYIEILEAWLTKISADAERRYYGWGRSGESALEKLAKHYREKKDHHNLLRLLLAKAQYESVSLDLYKEIQRLAIKLDIWETTRPNVMKAIKRNQAVLAEIYLYEDEWDEAIKLARQTNGYDVESIGTLIAEGVKLHRPVEAIEIYDKLVQINIARQSRETYKIAARYAEKVKSVYQKILKDDSAWRDYITGIRARYPRHRALQEEFKRL